MSAPIKQSSFSGGELSPALYARTDHQKYETGLRTLRNMLAMRHGGATRRPGTMYVGTTLNGGNQIRLMPFIFNETGNGQSYVLEFGNLYIAFYQNGGVVTSIGVPYTIVSPYLQADLQNLKFTETADIITIVHPNYAPMELTRIGATNWTLTAITYGQPIAGPPSLSIAGTAGTSAFFYVVTSVNARGEETAITFASSVDSQGLAPASLANPIKLTWGNVTGATYYKVYITPWQIVSLVHAPGAYGFIGKTPNPQFVDTGITPDYSNSPPIYNQLFQSAGNYPSAVGFSQQRRVFANTTNNPLGFWESVPGSYSNFNTHTTPDDSDAVISAIAGEEVNAIQAVTELKFMLLLTSGAEIYVTGNGNGVVTPSSINASVQSQYGCGPLRPLKIGDVLLFNQALGSFIRDFGFDFAIDGYRGNDVTVFSSHLFEGFSLADWAYQKVPDSIVWTVRNDGALLGMTYVREQQILAWHRHDFINGFVENVCAIPENGQYAVYLSIKRVINGATVRYIERMSSRIWLDEVNATYLDCFSNYNGTNVGATTMTLTASGSFTTDDTAYQQQLTLTASAGFFTSDMVGNEIFLSDAAFIAAHGNMVDPENPTTALSGNGNQIRCTVQAFISSTVVTVTPNRAVPANLQATPILTWARAVQTVSGLGYLIGQQVSIWADRFVVGSPLNTTIPTVYTVPASGILTLDKCYSVIYIGLPMTSDFQTLDIETSVGESILSRRKRQVKLGIYMLNTRSFYAGSEDPDANLDNITGDPLFQMFENKSGTNRSTYDEAPDLMTDQDYVIEDTRWNKNGRIFIRTVDPTPLTILAVSPGGDSPAPVPQYEKV